MAAVNWKVHVGGNNDMLCDTRILVVTHEGIKSQLQTHLLSLMEDAERQGNRAAIGKRESEVKLHTWKPRLYMEDSVIMSVVHSELTGEELNRVT